MLLQEIYDNWSRSLWASGETPHRVYMHYALSMRCLHVVQDHGGHTGLADNFHCCDINNILFKSYFIFFNSFQSIDFYENYRKLTKVDIRIISLKIYI